MNDEIKHSDILAALQDLEADEVKDLIEHSDPLKSYRDSFVSKAIAKYRENHDEDTEAMKESTADETKKKFQLREHVIKFCYKSGLDEDTVKFALETTEGLQHLDEVQNRLDKITNLYAAGEQKAKEDFIKAHGRQVEDGDPPRRAFTEQEIEAMSPEEYAAKRPYIYDDLANGLI